MASNTELLCMTADTAPTGDSVLCARIRGEIDHHTAAEIRSGIDKTIYEKRPSRLILDMSAVSFMDSSGLGLIMGRLSLMRELGGELILFNPSREICNMIRLAGMDKLLSIELSETATAKELDHTPQRRRGRTANTQGNTRRRRKNPLPQKGKSRHE